MAIRIGHGFPNAPDDVTKFIAILDKNKDDAISFDEFLQAVGRMGGSAKLFEVRRLQIEDRAGFRDSVHDKETLRAELHSCGIRDDSQNAWQVVASGSDWALLFTGIYGFGDRPYLQQVETDDTYARAHLKQCFFAVYVIQSSYCFPTLPMTGDPFGITLSPATLCDLTMSNFDIQGSMYMVAKTEVSERARRR